MLVLAGALAIAAPVAAHAQGDTTRRASQPPPMMGPPPRGGRGGPGGGPMRARYLRQIRQAFTRAVRDQVGLSDEQMQKLAPINQKYQRERQGFAQQERAARMALRDELSKPAPDEAKVAQLSDELQQYPRKRLDANDAEDKELAGIMTPVQLAKYRALQERVQRQLNDMRPPMGGNARPLPINDTTRGER
jgi:Spy/CpxP family protein refolding chaperone